MQQPRFSIVTPSFRASEWLKLCVTSVADQGVPLQHIVQDSCSDDGTQEWLPYDSRVEAFIEKDEGMYDAVNRGFRRAAGEIVAYLNCDEQYLPGALSAVSEAFYRFPKVDVLFAHAVVVDPSGDYICERKSLTPEKYHTQISGNLAFLTCSTFMRRRVFEKGKMWFNPNLRATGDCEWSLRMIENRICVMVLNCFTSAFTDTGANLSVSPGAREEGEQMAKTASPLVRLLRPVVILHYRLRRFFHGYYRSRPIEYSIYTKSSPAHRQLFVAKHPTYRWCRSP